MLTRRTILAAPLPLAVAACKRGASVIELSGATMGTTFSIVAVDHTRTIDQPVLEGAVLAALSEVNQSLSNWDAQSDVSRFNAASTTQPVAVAPELVDVVQAAQDVNAASGGHFDIALGPLIELWGFGANGTAKAMPDADAIVNALARTGQANALRVGPGSLQKTDPDTQIFLSAIGKGYGVDHVARAVEALGIRDYMIEIGGDLYTAGENPDNMPWQIGIETPDPLDRALQKVVGLSDMGMATSGDYRNYFEVDGQRYSHILDAVTGRPVTHTTASATVLTGNAMLADAWATAMLVLGRERGLEIADAQDLAVLFVERDAAAADLRFTATPSARFAALQG